MGAFAHLKARHAGAHIDRRGRSEIAGSLEDGTLLTVVEGHLFDIVERELPQVYLTILGIAQHDTVIAHCQMVGTHGAHIDRLHTAHAAIVFELHTREIAHGIGHRQG